MVDMAKKNFAPSPRKFSPFASIASSIDNKVITFCLICSAKPPSPEKWAIPSAAPCPKLATAAPAPKSARPLAIVVIATRNTALSPIRLALPPTASSNDNNVNTFALIVSANFSSELNLLTPSAAPTPNEETKAPAPNTARPAAIPVIAAAKKALSIKKSKLPPAASLIDNKVNTLFLTVSASNPTNSVAAAAAAEPTPNTPKPIPSPPNTNARVPPSAKNESNAPSPSALGTISKISFTLPETFSIFTASNSFKAFADAKRATPNPAAAIPAPARAPPILPSIEPLFLDSFAWVSEFSAVSAVSSAVFCSILFVSNLSCSSSNAFSAASFFCDLNTSAISFNNCSWFGKVWIADSTFLFCSKIAACVASSAGFSFPKIFFLEKTEVNSFKSFLRFISSSFPAPVFPNALSKSAIPYPYFPKAFPASLIPNAPSVTTTNEVYIVSDINKSIP